MQTGEYAHFTHNLYTPVLVHMFQTGALPCSTALEPQCVSRRAGRGLHHPILLLLSLHDRKRGHIQIVLY